MSAENWTCLITHFGGKKLKIHNRKNEVRLLRELAFSIILIIFLIVSPFTLAEAQRNLEFQEQQKQWSLLWLYQFPYGRLTLGNDSLSTGLIFKPSFPSYFSLFTDTPYLSILPTYYDLVRSSKNLDNSFIYEQLSGYSRKYHRN